MIQIKTSLFNTLLILCCISLAGAIQGQIDSTQIIKDSIQVTKSSTIETRKNAPYHIGIEHTEKTIQTLKPSYSKSNYDVTLDQPNPVIKPIKYKERKVKSSNDGLIKIGYGIPRAIDAKLMYDYHIEDWYNVGVSSGYSAANNVDIQNMLYDNWHANLYGGYWLNPSLKIFTDVGFTRLNQGLYGTFQTPSSESYIRNIQSFDSALGGTLSMFESKGLHVNVMGNYSSTAFIGEDNKQQVFEFGTTLSKTILKNLILDIDFNYGGVASANTDFKTNYWLGSPRLRYISEQWIGSLGVDITDSNELLQFWPRVKGEYFLPESPLSFGVSSQMKSELITLKSVSTINPFIQKSPFNPLSKITKQVNLFTTYSTKEHEATLNIGSQIVENETQYIYNLISQFTLGFIEPYQSLSFSINGSGELTDWLSYKGNIGYTVYDNIGSSIGYLPILHLDLGLSQRIANNKLSISETLLYTVRNERLNAAKQEPILDLSISIDYKLLSQFHLFVEGHNLLFQDYEIWDYYPIYSPRIVGGFKYIID